MLRASILYPTTQMGRPSTDLLAQSAQAALRDNQWSSGILTSARILCGLRDAELPENTGEVGVSIGKSSGLGATLFWGAQGMEPHAVKVRENHTAECKSASRVSRI